MAIQDIYPTALRLLGRPVLVVGGGPVAARRAKGLLDAGARVTVVAPVASAALKELADAGLLTWEPRPYRASTPLTMKPLQPGPRLLPKWTTSRLP